MPEERVDLREIDLRELVRYFDTVGDHEKLVMHRGKVMALITLCRDLARAADAHDKAMTEDFGSPEPIDPHQEATDRTWLALRGVLARVTGWEEE